MEFNLQNPPATNSDSTETTTVAALSTVSPIKMNEQKRGEDEVTNSNSSTRNESSESSTAIPTPTSSDDSLQGLTDVTQSKISFSFVPNDDKSNSSSNSSLASNPRRSNISANYSLRSPAVKRLLREAQELGAEPTHDFRAVPLEDNLFEWHFTIRGPADSDFSQGIYHGRIIMPPEYPMKPPSIILMTPSGRFETGVKICLSISNYHPETWRPSWSIRTALMALISFMATPSPGAIGSVECAPDVRRNLARKSLSFVCPVCGPIINDILHASGKDLVGCPTTAQRVFRLPHTGPQEETFGDDMDVNQLNAMILRRTHQGGDAADPLNQYNDNEGLPTPDNSDHGFENPIVDNQPAHNEDLSIIAVGALVIVIVGLVIRRVFMSTRGWNDLFEF